MAGKPEAPHGTNSAWKRHKRRGETPCQPCEDAHREHNAARRTNYHSGRSQVPQAAPAAPPGPASAPVTHEDSEQVRHLKRTRDLIMAAIERLAEMEPWKIPALSKELRETWREISALSKSDDDEQEKDAFDEFDLDGDESNVLRFTGTP